MNPVIGIDPGRQKCGVAVVDSEQRILWKGVVDTTELPVSVKKLTAKFGSNTIVMGNGTSSSAAQRALEMAFLEDTVILEMIDEYRTTDMAKTRYWEAHPPKGWRRLIPATMQSPPEPVDDYVAVILAERYIARHRSAE